MNGAHRELRGQSHYKEKKAECHFCFPSLAIYLED